MSKRSLHHITLILILTSLMAACVGQNPTTATPVSVTPSRTRAPTQTRRPSSTPRPSATPTSTPTATSTPQVAPDLGPDLSSFSPDGTFTVTFLEPMDAASILQPLLVFPYVAGTTAWDDGFTRLSFDPAEDLRQGQTYTFYLDSALKTAAGAGLARAYEWQVQVDRGPEIVSVSPSTNALSDRKPDIEITFDRAMDQETTAAALSILPSVPFVTSWKNDRVMAVQVQEGLLPGQRYDLRIAAGASAGASDTHGLALLEEYVKSYWMDPLEISVAVPDDRTVEVTFSYPINTTSTGLPYAIRPALDGSWSWVSPTKARFTTAAPLPMARRYELTLSGNLFDSEGLLPVSTATFGFSAPLPVSLDLAGTEVDYGYDDHEPEYPPDVSPIKLVFSIPVEHASVERAFHIEPEVPGTFAWRASSAPPGEVLEFLPSQMLEMGTTYRITLEDTAHTQDGQAFLLEAFTAEFATTRDWFASYWMPAFFGYGNNSQVVQADGPRLLQFGAKSPVRFDLYSTGLSRFLELYAEGGQTGSDYYDSWNDWSLLPVPAGSELPVSSWEYTPPPVSETIDETSLPSDLPLGLYVLNMVSEGMVYDQLFINLTNNALLAKVSTQEVFVWLKDTNGASIRNAEVRLYSESGTLLASGTTDGRGTLRLSVPEGSRPLMVVSRVNTPGGTDVTISGLTGSWRSINSYTSANYNSWWQRTGISKRYQVHTTTDRPIYLPGQTVNYSVILRRDQDVRYSLLPTGTSVTVEAYDSNNNLIASSELRTDSFGCVNGSFALGESAVLGTYRLVVRVGQEEHRQPFEVQEYRKPEIQVSLQEGEGVSNEHVIGDSFPVQIEAGYFFGEPLAGAAFTTHVYKLNNYYYDWGFFPSFEPSEGYWYHTQDIHIDPGQNRLSESGTAELVLRGDDFSYNDSFRSSYSSLIYNLYALEVEVDDGSNQPTTGVYIFKIYSASEQVTLDNDGLFQHPDQPFLIRAQVEDLAGQPVAGRQLSLSVQSWDFDEYEFRSSGMSFTLTTDENGRAQQELSLERGWYELELQGQDADGNPMSDIAWVNVFDSADDWLNRTLQEITITAEQDSYQPNQTARFLIESTFSGPALLTFERGHVLDSFPVELTAPLTIVEYRLPAAFAPNVFATINAWQSSESYVVDKVDYDYYGSNHPDAYLRRATTELQVDAGFQVLQVEISTDQESYAPGGSMQVTIDVKDSNGIPVSAEVSLAVVDESIFALQEELTPDLFATFYGRRLNSVYTYDSFAPDRIIVEPGGRGSGGGGLVAAGQRVDFQDTAAWFPALLTGTDGRVTVTVPLPDNLTSWRLTARAVTLDTRVGQAFINVETHKDLVVRPVLPASLTTGDQAEIQVMVHNYGLDSRSVELSFSAAGLDPTGEALQNVTIEPGQVVPVFWPVTVSGQGETQVSVSAIALDGATDSILLPLTIHPAVVASTQTLHGEFTGNTLFTFSLPQDSQVTPQISLQLNRSTRGAILTGLEYLTGYPYGCVEQTMSRALPNAVIGRLGSQLGDPGLQARTAPLIRESLVRLYGFQHQDGGWGWWFDDDSDDYQTAWVLFGLAQIRSAGYEVTPSVVERGVSFLEKVVVNDSVDARTRAFALYSMALNGQGNLEASLALMEGSMNELDPFSQAALALSLHELGDEENALAIMNALSLRAVRNGDQVYWPQTADDGEYCRKTMSSTLRTSAMMLNALLTIQPDNELIPGIARYLISNRMGHLGWGTTNETTFSILALTEYVLLQEKNTGTTQYQVRLNGTPLQDGSLGTGQMTTLLALPAGRLLSGENQITISSTGNIPLFYDLTEDILLPAQNFPTAGPISVQRAYLDPDTGEPVTRIEAGELVMVRLTVHTPEEMSFVIVEDRLPGGLQAVNEDLNTSPLGMAEINEDTSMTLFWSLRGYNYKQVYLDRVRYFFTSLRRNTYTFEYYARAVTPGTFLALPAEVAAMYDLDLWGRSQSSWITIEH